MIRFAYERFADHVVGRSLLSEYIDADFPEEGFGEDMPLGKIFEDRESCWRNRGLVETLSIQIPELVGRELVNLVPRAKGWGVVRQAFIESLIWRDADSFGEETDEYFETEILGNRKVQGELLEMLLCSIVASVRLPCIPPP